MDRLRYLLGILTLVVMAAGGWFLFDRLAAENLDAKYQIQVTFLDARGLKAGADIKFRGIRVGTVHRIDVEKDGSHAVVSVTIVDDRVDLVRTNSRFWIVTPRFHGISSGVTGLDTLVRDAYLSFSTPQPFGEPLARSSRLSGQEAPLTPHLDVTLPQIERGDLLMRVLLPENHGITVGARVMFRGMATGEVRSLALAPSGTHVEVGVRVLSRFRSTVTDASVFWVAKPQVNLRFSFSNPVSLNELGSLLSPYIAYYTPPQTGVPVHDGYPFAALLKRPSIVVTEVPQAALAAMPEVAPKLPTGPIIMVRVVYEATDIDYLSPNDTLHREGTGILYVDSAGQTLIMTPRSVCDASYFYRETFGERAKIKDEKLVVQLPGSKVLKATRIWIQPKGIDLAVLLVEGLPRKYPITKASALEFVDHKTVDPKGLVLLLTGERGVPQKPTPFDLATVKLEEALGGVLLRGDIVIGFVGQTSEDNNAPSVVTLVTLPESLRPQG